PRSCSFFFCFVLLLRPTSTLFPYTTLFRSPGLGIVGVLYPNRNFCFDCRKNARRVQHLRTEVAHFHCFFYREVRNDRSTLDDAGDRKSTRLNSSHVKISYAVFCLKKKTETT